MFVVDLNQQANVIQVKNNSTVVAEGNFAFDEPDRTVLILFKNITIASNNHEELNQFFSVLISYVGQLYTSLICLRLPAIFDNQIDWDKFECKNKITNFMSVTMDHLKYYPNNNLHDKQEQYELITDKQLMLDHAEQLVKMMNKEAFWSSKWNPVEMRNRINSATYNAMILDKLNNTPCGFGRLFLLTTDDSRFGYLSDIAVDSSYQSKGLGRIIVNSLVGSSINQDIEQQREINGTLCLQCADQGSGALSAPKLYRRSGFEFVDDISNHTAILGNSDNYVKIFK